MTTALMNKLFLRLLIILLPFTGLSTVDHWETVIYETNTWKYLVPTTSVSPTWINPGFNDASWSSGIGGFGFGDNDDNTTFGQTISCFQRIQFNIVDLSAIEMMVLNVDFDDGFIAYLNGVEIARLNLAGSGQATFNQLASAQHEAVMYQGGYPNTYTFDLSQVQTLLNNGSNVFCIQVHNAAANSSDMSSRVFLSLGITNTSSNYGTPPPWFNPPLVFTDSNLPIIVIDTENGATIPDAPKINATMGIIYNGPGLRNYLSDPFNEYSGNIGIERRGSSSQSFPKKQYSIETRDNFGNRNDITVFNMAYDNDWVLYAPYSDKSLIRNVLAYSMGWDLGSYAPRTKLCEVVLNGEYMGVFVFTEKIKRKDGKVGTNDVKPEDISGNELTGDYVLKVDKLTAGSVVAWNSPIPPFAGATQDIDFILHDPTIDSLNITQQNYIQTYITDFENALNGPNFLDPQLGYAPYIDKKSFVDFFLVNELSHNVDGYRISSYIHKIRTSEGGKLFAGPLWDFNLAFGNANYCNGSNTGTWEIDFYQYCSGDGWQNPFWWKKLLQDQEYTHLVNCTWQEMRLGPWHTDSLMARIDSLASYLDESQARNFQRWPIFNTYVWPNNFIGSNYQEEIDYLKTWLTNRLIWMDANMFGACPDLGVEESLNSGISMYPNPASDHLTISSDRILSNGQVKLIDVAGNVIQEWGINDSHGFDLQWSPIRPGIYFIRITSADANYQQKIVIE